MLGGSNDLNTATAGNTKQRVTAERYWVTQHESVGVTWRYCSSWRETEVKGQFRLLTAAGSDWPEVPLKQRTRYF